MATLTRTTTVTRTVVPVTQRHSPARGWLKTLGFLMVILGILGVIPYVVNILHDYNVHMDAGMAAFHWVAGLIALVCAYALRNNLHLAIATIALGVIFLLVGGLSFMYTDTGAFWHAGVADNLLHLVLGTITLLVGINAFNREREVGKKRPAVAGTA